MHSVNTQKNFWLKNKVNLHHYISTEIGAFSAGVHPDDVRFQLKHRKPGYALVGQLRKVVTDYYGGINKDMTAPLPNETFVKMCELYRADENVQLVQTWVRACCCHPPFYSDTLSHFGLSFSQLRDYTAEPTITLASILSYPKIDTVRTILCNAVEKNTGAERIYTMSGGAAGPSNLVASTALAVTASQPQQLPQPQQQQPLLAAAVVPSGRSRSGFPPLAPTTVVATPTFVRVPPVEPTPEHVPLEASPRASRPSAARRRCRRTRPPPSRPMPPPPLRPASPPPA